MEDLRERRCLVLTREGATDALGIDSPAIARSINERAMLSVNSNAAMRSQLWSRCCQLGPQLGVRLVHVKQFDLAALDIVDATLQLGAPSRVHLTLINVSVVSVETA